MHYTIWQYFNELTVINERTLNVDKLVNNFITISLD
jgi:hypothetical protein